ncbi:HemX protein [Ereboglobus sp. PH5-10]|uniref:cytochrome C assembly family protein n=1 Tax=Ereboglobus sp. PH5-10 TaxID=2940629 RepID=UPI002406FF83|nr:cytochrome c biogenesis protein CcsA [Ereboglobus sp. PH5-10]MDF9826636.1 HemX protein [Ereboglobus sp. PH5-10]
MTETFLTDRAWLWLAAALYLGGFLFGVVPLIRRGRHSNRLAFFIMLAGFAAQTLGLYLRGKAISGCPIGNTFEILQFTTWSAVALYFVVGAVFRLSLLGFFTSAFAAALSLVSLAVPAWDAVRRASASGGNAWVEFHAALALFSYGVFGLLALTSAMYLLQWFSIKRRRMDGIFSLLPPMQALDQINLRLLTTGVVLLGASLAVAIIHWQRTAGHAINSAMLFLGAIWFLYAVALSFRRANIVPARRLAWVCIALFTVAIATLGVIDAHRLP